MRSVSELLRTYNFVNTPEGTRSTVRFFAAFIALAAGVFMVLFVAFGGSNGGDPTFRQSEADQVYAEQTDSGWYIGYPTELYHEDHKEIYSEEAIDDKLETWMPDGAWIVHKDPVYSDDEHRVLLGYHVQLSPFGLTVR